MSDLVVREMSTFFALCMSYIFLIKSKCIYKELCPINTLVDNISNYKTLQTELFKNQIHA